MKTIYLDGRFLKVNAQLIEVFTPGVFKAKGVFETMLGLDHRVLDTALHLQRLKAGLKILGIRAPVIDPSLLRQVLDSNHLSCGRVRLMVWRSGKQAHILITAIPYKIPNKKHYRVCFLKTDRTANARWANVKSLEDELFAQASSQARAQGFDEALLINRRGFIFEASRANIFWIKGKVLYTPPLSSGCLNGITRQQVIKEARKLKLAVKERNLTAEILKKADHAFLTNSLIGIKPIEPSMIRYISNTEKRI